MAIKQTDFETTAAAATRTGFGRAWVKRMAVLGRIPGAVKLGERCWMIPTDWQPVRQRAKKRS